MTVKKLTNDEIVAQLKELTGNYLTHLYYASIVHNPGRVLIDQHDDPIYRYLEALTDDDKTTNPNYQALKEKQHIVIQLWESLNKDNTSSVDKIRDFEKLLYSEKNIKIIQSHRKFGPAFLKGLFIILATGVIPGLIGFGIYAAVTGRSPLFFAEPHGKVYSDDCKHIMPITERHSI